jgi:hypothetical protein
MSRRLESPSDSIDFSLVRLSLVLMFAAIVALLDTTIVNVAGSAVILAGQAGASGARTAQGRILDRRGVDLPGVCKVLSRSR